MATKSLYVGNLPYSTTESQLEALFNEFGGTNARIIEGRGFGFVDVDADKMEDAVTAKHNAEVDGRRLTVNEARPRESRPRYEGGGGGGGGYGGGGGSGAGRRGGRGGGGGGRDRGRGGRW